MPLQNPAAWATLGHVRYLSGDLKEAQSAFERALAFVGDCPEIHSVHLRLGDIYLQSNQASFGHVEGATGKEGRGSLWCPTEYVGLIDVVTASKAEMSSYRAQCDGPPLTDVYPIHTLCVYTLVWSYSSRRQRTSSCWPVSTVLPL